MNRKQALKDEIRSLKKSIKYRDKKARVKPTDKYYKEVLKVMERALKNRKLRGLM